MAKKVSPIAIAAIAVGAVGVVAAGIVVAVKYLNKNKKMHVFPEGIMEDDLEDILPNNPKNVKNKIDANADGAPSAAS